MLREMAGPIRAAEEYAQLAASSPRESQVWKEASGVVSSCGGAVIGIIIAKAGIAAAPFSAGTSLALSYVALAGTAASGVQCLNSLWRTYNEFVNPAENDYYDSLGWYQTMTVALDGISLVGAGSTTFATVKTIMAIKHSTGREVTDVLRHMSRQERAKLTTEVLRLKNPRHPSAMVRLKQLSGQLPRRFSNSQIRLSIMTQIQDQIGATLAVAGSTLSGNVNHVIVALYEEFDSHEI
jgi:hypothetical protein